MNWWDISIKEILEFHPHSREAMIELFEGNAKRTIHYLGKQIESTKKGEEVISGGAVAMYERAERILEEIKEIKES